MRKYFVSYKFQLSNGQAGHGEVEISRENGICGIADIEEVSAGILDHVTEKVGVTVTAINVLFWQEFDKD